MVVVKHLAESDEISFADCPRSCFSLIQGSVNCEEKNTGGVLLCRKKNCTQSLTKKEKHQGPFAVIYNILLCVYISSRFQPMSWFLLSLTVCVLLSPGLSCLSSVLLACSSPAPGTSLAVSLREAFAFSPSAARCFLKTHS